MVFPFCGQILLAIRIHSLSGTYMLLFPFWGGIRHLLTSRIFRGCHRFTAHCLRINWHRVGRFKPQTVLRCRKEPPDRDQQTLEHVMRVSDPLH